jgi:hypothetical protein
MRWTIICTDSTWPGRRQFPPAGSIQVVVVAVAHPKAKAVSRKTPNLEILRMVPTLALLVPSMVFAGDGLDAQNLLGTGSETLTFTGRTQSPKG